MSALVDLEIASELLERSKVDLVVTGFFRDELPLRGGVGRADWRMCGLISDQILAGRLKGDFGEALLVPSSGRLRARRVMVLGLGERGRYRLPEVRDAIRDVVERGLALDVRSIGMSPLGLGGEDFSRCAEAIAGGIADGFGRCERSLRIRFVLPESEVAIAGRSLAEAIRSLQATNLSFPNKIAAASKSSETPNRPAIQPPSPR